MMSMRMIVMMRKRVMVDDDDDKEEDVQSISIQRLGDHALDPVLLPVCAYLKCFHLWVLSLCGWSFGLEGPSDRTRIECRVVSVSGGSSREKRILCASTQQFVWVSRGLTMASVCSGPVPLAPALTELTVHTENFPTRSDRIRAPLLLHARRAS